MDPWDWDAEEVARQLFDPSRSWSLQSFTKNPPFSFADTLKLEEINGQSLLSDLNHKTLRDEPFCIATFGQRSAIVRAIELLRSISPTYVSHNTRTNQTQEQIFNPAPTPAPSHLPEPSSTSHQDQTIKAWSEKVDPDTNSLITPRVDTGVAPEVKDHVETTSDRRKRRRIQPITMPLHIVHAPALLDRLPSARSSYLGAYATDLDEMFWGQAGVGDVLDMTSDDDDNFDITEEPTPLGHQKFILRRLHHYFQHHKFVDVDRDGTRAIARAYPNHLVKEGRRQIVTLVDRNSHVPVFKKADAILLDHADVPSDVDVSNTQWDFLLRHEEGHVTEDMADSDSLPSYSGSLLAEIEAEDQERYNMDKKKMTFLEVDALISVAIEAYEQQWFEELLPKRQMKAHLEWRNGQRRGQIEGVRRTIRHLEDRMSRFRKEIHHEVWKKASQVTEQCRIMDLTVFDLQDALWKLDLWKQPCQPQKLAGIHLAAVPKARRSTHGDDDIESLQSESSSMSGDEGLIDFIDIDDLNVPSTTGPLESTSMTFSSPTRPTADTGPELEDEEVCRPIKLEKTDESTSQVHSSWPFQVKSEGPLVISLSSDEGSPQPPDSTDEGFSKSPIDADDVEIERWSWQTLEERNDRKRIILKLLYYMEPNQREALLGWMFGELMLNQLQKRAQHGIRLYQEPSQQGAEWLHMSRLFLCWISASSRYWDTHARDEAMIQKALAALNTEFGPFYNVIDVFRSKFGADSDEDQESDDEMNTLDTPRKRKRVVKVSKRGKDLQADAAARRQAEELRVQQNMVDLQSSQQGIEELKTSINPGKKEDEEYININSFIARRIKDYQIEGVRFMWREVTVTGHAAQGCLLAHTMGLGKTMQTITLLVTIVEAAASSTLREQLPEPLRNPRFLILCPPGLIENWKAEFNQWVPANCPLQRLFTLELTRKEERLAIVQDWYSAQNGVLIIGYEMFRDLISNRPSYPTDDYQVFTNMLLQGPALVIADEAHKMKNQTSSTAAATKKFSTSRRIALTGSPLANNLVEYYAMIDWVAPDFLGDRQEFIAYYQNPIEEGIRKDSTRAAQRFGLKKLKLLKSAIRDKIHRADITVLKDTLKPKTEFVLTISLTDLQRELYAAVISALKGGEIASSGMFDVIDYLKTLCNHPEIFSKKLLSPVRNSQKKDKLTNVVEDSSGVDGPETVAVKIHLKNALGKKVQELGDLTSVFLSNKMLILRKIVEMSKDAGEGVLIFSQSLLTLDYIQRMLSRDMPRVQHQRLDGQTKTSARQGLAQEFNSGRKDVFLISTNAGGLGLNVPAANRVILVDFSFNPAVEEQAVGRAYRIGQTKPVYVYHLITGGTYEEPLHETTIFKKQLSSRTVDDKTPLRAGGKMKEYIFEPQETKTLSPEKVDLYRGKDKVMDHLLQDEATSKTICGIMTAETLHADIDEKLSEEEEREVQNLIELAQLRKTNPREWERRRHEGAMSENSAYDMLAEEQMRQFAESHARHGGSLSAWRPTQRNVDTATSSEPIAVSLANPKQLQHTEHQSKQAMKLQVSGGSPPAAEMPFPPSQASSSPVLLTPARQPNLANWKNTLGPAMMGVPTARRLLAEAPQLGQTYLRIAGNVLRSHSRAQTDYQYLRDMMEQHYTRKPAGEGQRRSMAVPGASSLTEPNRAPLPRKPSFKDSTNQRSEWHPGQPNSVNRNSGSPSNLSSPSGTATPPRLLLARPHLKTTLLWAVRAALMEQPEDFTTLEAFLSQEEARQEYTDAVRNK
ncbi:hypothetical protein FH972_023571 [Carpinus fangiana]|uniref:Uncharacterized protein n=1 Tax=Carpinus fangiana TaxID=176857 RepID=A0A5N6KVJ7_9ROSI|nr:hypothetical protein FH972_023571 [Carpinus fangiana]